MATAQAGPGLRQLGWSRSAPGAAGHTADSPGHLRFALRRQTPKLPGLIVRGFSTSLLLRSPPGGRGAAGAPEHLVSLRKLFPSRIQLGTEHPSNMVCKALITLCIFAAGTWRGPRKSGAWGRQPQAPGSGWWEEGRHQEISHHRSLVGLQGCARLDLR